MFKKKWNLDNIISILIAVTLLYAIYELFNARTLPFNWRLIAIALLSILALLAIAINFKKLPKWATITRRIICVLLAIVLGLGGFYVSKGGSFIRGITDVKDSSVKISIMVHKDSGIKDIEDLKGKRVGYQNGVDASNSSWTMKKINKEVKKIKYVSDVDYMNLVDSLKNNELDAIIISDSYILSVEDFEEGYTADLVKIKTYSRTLKDEKVPEVDHAINLNENIFTVLISGQDDIGDPNHNGKSDVCMLVIVNPMTKFIQMISFPRDAYLPNPALGNINDKLTHTGNNGIDNTMKAIENVLGIKIDYYAKVNFTSVVEIVDTIGGITVDVPIAFCEQDSQRLFTEGHLQCLDKGKQEVDGEEALAFARHRKTEGVGDIGRTKAQQQVLRAIIEKLLTVEGMSKVPALLDVIPKYVVTNISDSQLENFVSYQLDHLSTWTMKSMTLENGLNYLLVTASMGNIPLSTNVLNKFDILDAVGKYYAIVKPKSFNEFSFDLDNLELDTTDFTFNTDIIYAGDDISNYTGTPIEEEVEEPSEEVTEEPIEPEEPEISEPEEPIEPSEPVEPIEPSVPETPSEGQETSETIVE